MGRTITTTLDPAQILNTHTMKYLIETITIVLTAIKTGESIKCYQCASTEDQQKITGIWSKDKFSQDRFEDRCGVYWPFQKERNTPVECNSDESHTPGTFCVKIVKQGPAASSGTGGGARCSGGAPPSPTQESPGCATGACWRTVCTGRSATAARTAATPPRPCTARPRCPPCSWRLLSTSCSDPCSSLHHTLCLC